MNLKIEPISPFDLDLSAGIFSFGNGRIRKYEEGRYWQVLRLGERLALATVRSLGTIDEPVISVELEPDEQFSSREKTEAAELVGKIFNVDLDLRPFYQAIRADRVMYRLTRVLWGLKSPTTSTVFEALIHSIIEQQISLNAAWSLQGRLTEAYGDVLVLGQKKYYAFPLPEALANATVDGLRACGLSGRKAEYIRGVSQLAAEGLDLEGLKVLGDEEIIETLSKIRGVGVWTAELTVLRGMQRFDAIPADDLGIRRAVSHYYCDDRKISGAEVRKTAEQWKGWRGLAGFYLLTAERLNVGVSF